MKGLGFMRGGIRRLVVLGGTIMAIVVLITGVAVAAVTITDPGVNPFAVHDLRHGIQRQPIGVCGAM
jgi:hypothetical protein